jgi:hypothetical protein
MYCSADYKIDYHFPILELVQTDPFVGSACIDDPATSAVKIFEVVPPGGPGSEYGDKLRLVSAIYTSSAVMINVHFSIQ